MYFRLLLPLIYILYVIIFSMLNQLSTNKIVYVALVTLFIVGQLEKEEQNRVGHTFTPKMLNNSLTYWPLIGQTLKNTFSSGTNDVSNSLIFSTGAAGAIPFYSEYFL